MPFGTETHVNHGSIVLGSGASPHVRRKLVGFPLSHWRLQALCMGQANFQLAFTHLGTMNFFRVTVGLELNFGD